MDKLNKVLYSVFATAVDGRNGHVVSESGRLDYKLAKPESMGGPGGDHTNPEELFACGYAACFGGAMEYVAAQREIEIETPSVRANVHFGATDSGVALAVNIDAKIPNLSDELVHEIMNEAHEKVCPYSKATRGNIEVTLGLLD